MTVQFVRASTDKVEFKTEIDLFNNFVDSILNPITPEL